MIRQYIRQAFQLLKENKLLAAVSLLGTALSIAMVMVVVLVFQVQLTSFYPEYHRDRMLYQINGAIADHANGSRSQGQFSLEAIKEVFYPLESAEAVTAFTNLWRNISLPGRRTNSPNRIRCVDTAFWQVFGFRFVAGKAFTEADFQSGVRQIVLASTLARRLFGTDSEAVGKEVHLDGEGYTVCGVVTDVSKVADIAYAEAWLPYTSQLGSVGESSHEQTIGRFNVCILAPSSGRFAAIREELEKRQTAYNATKRDVKLDALQCLYTRMEIAMGSEGDKRVGWGRFLAEKGSVLLFLLVIPALNLLGVLQSSVRKRRQEIGVRKAFGATTGSIVGQVLLENLVSTFLGGVVGLLLSLFLVTACKEFLFAKAGVELSVEMLLKPGVFLAAFLSCLLLNVLSAGLPAWSAARKTISDSLHDSESDTNK